MKKNQQINWKTANWIACILLLCISACKKEPIVYTTSSNLNITGFLDKNPEKFSEFRKILEISETSGFLQAYGKYTVFIPNNDAVKTYLESINKTAVEQLDAAELRKLVMFHVLNDTVATKDFGDGKIKTLTMYGQYLTTGSVTVGGDTKLTINRQANIVSGNIRLGNGIVHEIDHVLIPATLTLSQMIKANPADSIFAHALEATGLDKTLDSLTDNAGNRKWYSVLVESNQTLSAAGFNSYADLKKRFSKLNPTDPKDSLNLFVKYHIIPDVKYLSDIASATSHSTLAAPEILTSKLVDQNVVLNDVLFNGKYEPGFILNRDLSDKSASNGVLHHTAPYLAGNSNGHFEIKLRKPAPVYWDVADFPEIRKLAGYWRKADYEFIKLTSSTTPIEGWNWEKTAQKYSQKYTYDPTTKWVNLDAMNLRLGIPTVANPGSATNAWVEMKSPVVVRGRYKVWACYWRREQTGKWPTGRRTQCQVTIDGEVMQKPFDFAEPPPTGSTQELESQGWKYYTSNPTFWTAAAPNVYVGKMIGIIEIKSTNNHKVRLDVIQGNSNTDFLDMIHFIPVDAPSQILPRFRTDGTEDYTVIN